MVKMDMYDNEGFYDTEDDDEEEEPTYRCVMCGKHIDRIEYFRSGMCLDCEVLTVMMINGNI